MISQKMQRLRSTYWMKRSAQVGIVALSCAPAAPAIADALTWQHVGTTGPMVTHDGTLVVLPSGAPLAHWDGTLESWTFDDHSVHMSTQDLMVYNGAFVAAGLFEPGIEILTHDGWIPLGGGTNGQTVVSLAGYEGDLVAGGFFTEVGGIPVNRIARWDGQSWSAIGDGMNSGVISVVVHDGMLVAGGFFAEADGKTANHVAAWDGESWQPLGEGLDGNVWALLSHQGQLFAGGEFSSHIAVWNGTTWEPVAGGLDNDVYALTIFEGDLVAAGSPHVVAQLQDGAWQDISQGVSLGSLRGLHVFDGELFARTSFGLLWRYGSGGFTWTPETNSGDFSSTNWLSPMDSSMDIPPGIPDRAIFNFSTVPTIDFTQDQVTDRLIMRKGNVTFNMNGYQYEQLNTSFVTPSLLMGLAASDSSSLTIRDGTLHSAYGSIGESPGSFGTLRLDEDATLNIDQTIWAGWQGVGQIDVESGAALDVGNLTIAAGIGSFGDVAILDAESLLHVEWNATVGDGGVGFMTLLDGAQTTIGNMTIGESEPAHGETVLNGADTGMVIAGDLNISWRGVGLMLVENGATLEVHDSIRLAMGSAQPPLPGVRGSLHVHGEGTIATAVDSVVFGPFAASEVMIAQGGRLVVGDYFGHVPGASVNHQRTVHFEFSSAEQYDDVPAIEVANVADLALTDVEVRLLDGYEPQIGDRFLLVTASSIIEPNSYDLPELPGDLHWKIVEEPTQLSLEVFEPAPGDLNADGVVNVDDLLILLNAWGECVDCDDCTADITGDCAVGVDDLIILLNNWTG